MKRKSIRYKLYLDIKLFSIYANAKEIEPEKMNLHLILT